MPLPHLLTKIKKLQIFIFPTVVLDLVMNGIAVSCDFPYQISLNLFSLHFWYFLHKHNYYSHVIPFCDLNTLYFPLLWLLNLLLYCLQFNSLKDQGTRIVIYNLWEDDQGDLELDFDTNDVCFWCPYIFPVCFSFLFQILLTGLSVVLLYNRRTFKLEGSTEMRRK